MSTVRIPPAAAGGQLAAPPSKSAAHRLLIAAALGGSSRVHGILPSQDMQATLRCLSALGAQFEQTGDTVLFSNGVQFHAPVSAVTADCGESGSTLRFFVPLFAALGQPVTLIGSGRLPQRPLTVYEQCLPPNGVTLSRPPMEGGVLSVSGKLHGGRFEVAGDISSQFITGLLFALPLCKEDSRLILTSPLQSKGYVQMTLEALGAAGIRIVETADGYDIAGGQVYRPFDLTAEGDWSQAAFLLAAGAIGGQVAVSGLRSDTAQGDKRIVSLLRQFGADITEKDGLVCCRRAPLRGIEADVSDIPDLVPALSVVAATAAGTTRLYNASRLRLKESDRLTSTASLLRTLGVRVEETADELHIFGGALHGGTVDGFNDHRIVMSAAVAAFAADGEITVTDADSICKSWPSFFEDYQRIGGQSHEL